MVDILVDWQLQEFDFNDETVTMELLPLDVGSIFKLMAINVESPDERQIETITAIFNGHVRNIGNLTVNGKPATCEQLANIGAFMSLSADIMTRLTQISELPKTEAKN